jgi:hypothetical protein
MNLASTRRCLCLMAIRAKGHVCFKRRPVSDIKTIHWLWQRDRFFLTIADEIAPDKNTVIALGDGQFAATINGLASCPIAKVVETLAHKRRVVYVPEYNTTKRCSYCKSPDAVTKGAKSDQTRVSGSGHEYRVQIHGLRHCTSRDALLHARPVRESGRECGQGHLLCVRELLRGPRFLRRTAVQ